MSISIRSFDRRYDGAAIARWFRASRAGLLTPRVRGPSAGLPAGVELWPVTGAAGKLNQLYWGLPMTPGAEDEAEPDATQPVGQGDYVVQPGDCIESIAAAEGFYWQTLWDLGENADLKRARKPNVLLPGDRVTIPRLRQRTEARRTDAQHRFVLRGVPSRLRLRFVDDTQQPRAGIVFTLTIDDVTRRGKLDSDGALDVNILPSTAEGTIELESDDGPETYSLKLGQLDPQSAPTGVAGRLKNLGFAFDPDSPDELRWAIMRFQQANDIDATGTMDDNTLAALMDRHES